MQVSYYTMVYFLSQILYLFNNEMLQPFDYCSMIMSHTGKSKPNTLWNITCIKPFRWHRSNTKEIKNAFSRFRSSATNTPNTHTPIYTTATAVCLKNSSKRPVSLTRCVVTYGLSLTVMLMLLWQRICFYRRTASKRVKCV